MIVFTGIRGGSSVAASGEDGGGGACQAESSTAGRSGLARLWGIPCGAVAAVTFNANQEVTAVALRCDSPDTDWQEIGFEQDGGQLAQSQVGTNRYNQTVRVVIDGQSSYNRRQINALGACPCWHFIALDEAGTYHYLGIHTYDRTGSTVWESAGMATAGNTAATGTAVTEGTNQFTIGLGAAAVHQLAPHAIGGPSVLSVPCNDNQACGPLGLTDLAGDCLEALDGSILEAL